MASGKKTRQSDPFDLLLDYDLNNPVPTPVTKTQLDFDECYARCEKKRLFSTLNGMNVASVIQLVKEWEERSQEEKDFKVKYLT